MPICTAPKDQAQSQEPLVVHARMGCQRLGETPVTCGGHPEPPQRSGSAGGKNSENRQFFLTRKQSESQDFATLFMATACGGVPHLWRNVEMRI